MGLKQMNEFFTLNFMFDMELWQIKKVELLYIKK